MKYARLSSENAVVETFVPADGFALEDCFHSSVASQFVPVPDHVEQNWVKQEDGTFTAPVIVEPTAPEFESAPTP